VVLGCLLVVILPAKAFASQQPALRAHPRRHNAHKITRRKTGIVIFGVEIPKKDNGYDLNWAQDLRHPIRYANKAELAREITKRLGAVSCITELRLYGHGNDGSIGVGRGQSPHYPTLRCTHIGNDNEADWESAFANIKGSFCANGRLILVGCNVAADLAGERLIADLAAYFNATVYAPTDFIHARSVYRGTWKKVKPHKQASIVYDLPKH
jgi:hypothetical protein